METDDDFDHYSHVHQPDEAKDHRADEEGDAIVGKMLAAVSELDLEQDTIVVFASDNADGPGARNFGGDMPDMPRPDLITARLAT